MTDRRRTPSLWLAAGVAWIALQVLLQHRGLLTHDTRLDLLLDPREFLSRIWHLWDPQADMGRVQNQAVGYLFPMGPVMLLGDLLSVPPWITERVWIALLLGVAFWGTARVADELDVGTPITRLIGAASYALSPFFIARIGNTSGFVQGAALLPWVLLPLLRGAREGSPRRTACLSGLAVVAIGGVNAAETGAVLVVPLLWLLTRGAGPRRAALLRWWIGATFCATAWWALPLLLQGRYGLDFLPLTERAALTTGATAPFEVVRGAADWLSHVIVGVPQLPAGWTLVSSRPIIAATGVVAAIGVVGLTQRDAPERRFFVLTFAVGVALVGIGFGGTFGNPFASSARDFLDGAGAAFRTVNKFQPIVMLPLAIGVTHMTAIAVAAAERRRPDRLAYPTTVLLLAALAVIMSAQPLLTQDLLNAKPFDDVPEWWTSASAAVADAPGRTLLLPGLPQSYSEWGYTGEEPLQWLARQPWATRSLIPLGSYGAIRYLDAVETVVSRGGDPALVAFLQRGGFTRVLVRNDGEWQTFRAPSPIETNDALVRTGLRRIDSFGPAYPGGGRSLVGDLHQIELYEVPSTGDPRVATYAATDLTVVNGDPSSPLLLDRWGLAARPLVLASDLAGDNTPANLVVTDGNRRRLTDFGTTRHNQGFVLAEAESGRTTADVNRGEFPGTRREDQTVAERDDIAEVRASSYGSIVRSQPEWAPPRAIDGDPATAWTPAVELQLRGQWLEVEFDEPRSIASINLQLRAPSDRADAIRAVRITTAQGAVDADIDQGEDVQHIAVPQGTTDWLRVTITSANPRVSQAGISELIIPGVTGGERLEPPDALVDTSTREQLPVYVFQRILADPRSGESTDPETSLTRRFRVPKDAAVAVDAKVTVPPGAAGLDLVDDTAAFRISASSTLGSLPAFAARNLVDDDDTSAWIAGVLDDGFTADPDPHVVMQWNEPRTLDRLVLRSAPGYALPRTVRVTANGEVRTAPVSRDGTARFAPVTTTEAAVDFVLPAPSPFGTGDGDSSRRVGMTLLEFPALHDLTAGTNDRRAVVRVDCAHGPSVTVGDVTRRFSATATLDDVIAGRAVDAEPCDRTPATVPAGDADLSTDDGGPFTVTSVRLAAPDVALDVLQPTPVNRSVAIARWDRESRSITVGAGDAVYLAVNENANEGWTATLDGRTLEQVVLDGWRQGYLVPAGAGGTIELRYGPTTAYRAFIVFGALLVLLLVAAALLAPRRGDGAAPVGAGSWPVHLPAAIAVVLAFVIGGPLAAGVTVVLLVRPIPRVDWLVGALLLLAVGGATVPYGRDPEQYWGADGRVVSALVTIALAVLLASMAHTGDRPAAGDTRNP